MMLNVMSHWGINVDYSIDFKVLMHRADIAKKERADQMEK
jgi:hypothetical protein